MSEQAALVPVNQNKMATGIIIADMDGLARFAGMVHRSGMAPKGFGNVEAIGVAIQHGLELGLAPLQALQSIAVINGRPGIYGDAAMALVRGSGLLEWIKEEMKSGKSEDEFTAVCTSKRVGDPEPRTTTFSVKDAKRAGLWGKGGPWSQYPQRMLMFRARGFNLRDNFPDVLRGIKTVEELQDIPQDKQSAPKRVAHVETPQLPPPTDQHGEIIEGASEPSETDGTLDLDIKDTVEDFQGRIATAEKGADWGELGSAISRTEGLIGKELVEKLLAALRERRALVDPSPRASDKKPSKADMHRELAAKAAGVPA